MTEVGGVHRPVSRALRCAEEWPGREAVVSVSKWRGFCRVIKPSTPYLIQYNPLGPEQASKQASIGNQVADTSTLCIINSLYIKVRENKRASDNGEREIKGIANRESTPEAST